MHSPQVAVDPVGVDHDVAAGGVGDVGAGSADGAQLLVQVVDVGVEAGADFAAGYVAEDVFEQDVFGDAAGVADEVGE